MNLAWIPVLWFLTFLAFVGVGTLISRTFTRIYPRDACNRRHWHV